MHGVTQPISALGSSNRFSLEPDVIGYGPTGLKPLLGNHRPEDGGACGGTRRSCGMRVIGFQNGFEPFTSP